MGLFSKNEETDAYEVVRPTLAVKDGKLHVAMLRSYSTWATTKFHYDENYACEVDAVLCGMQEDGYEIVNIQHAAMSSGTGVGVTTTPTLVTYK